MPTPIGHALGGAIVYSFSDADKKKKWLVALLVIFFAELPDIDFLFGFFVGNPNKYHHQFTHSFFFVILAGLIGAWLCRKTKLMQFRASAVLFIAAGFSHILLDFLAVDTSAPFGEPVFWPFWNKFFISPFQIFSDVHRASDSGLFFKSMLNLHNLKTIILEIGILTPIAIIIELVKRSKKKTE